ncbi:MAG: hypothetical protein ACE5KH_00700 [Candidatus Geothermarchaeales archaeon]
MRRPGVPPAVALFLLSPAVGELLSGSSPPAEFFNPIVFLLLASLYGSGAILMRELMVRWRKGCASLLLLGAAYGVIEEGLMVKSFFDPGWVDLGILGSFGRWWGINWVWAEMLTFYHAVFSITIPVILVELAYPQQKDEKWIGRRGFWGFTGLLLGVVLFGYLALTPYWPPALQYLSSIAATVFFIYLAHRVPAGYGASGKKTLRRPWVLWLVGFSGTVSSFLLFGAGPFVISSPWLVMALGVLIFGGFFWLLTRWEWKEATRLHRLSVSAGLLSFFVVLAPLQELDQGRADDPSGMALVGLAFLVGLLLMAWRIRKREEEITVAVTG